MSENPKNRQATKCARRRTDKIGDTACLRHASGVSLSRTQFVFLGLARQIKIKTPYCCEAGETKTQMQLPVTAKTGGIGHFVTSTAGYLYWRGGFPPPTPSFRHAKNRGEFC